MNNNRKIAIVAGTVSLIATLAVNYIKNTSYERQKRAEIETETELQLNAMNVAKERVRARIRSGEYYNNGKNFSDIVADFNFEVIAAREEN